MNDVGPNLNLLSRKHNNEDYCLSDKYNSILFNMLISYKI